MTRKRITDGQVLEVIRSYIGRHRHSPALSEIAAEVGTSVSNAFRYVERLERRGQIVRARAPGGRALARGIRLVPPPADPFPAGPKAGGGRGEDGGQG